MISRLTALQNDVLAAFFARDDRFFLTGGAALAGFHLGHRTTQDLDLFTVEDVLDEAETSLRLAAEDLGGTVERVRTSPEFRRRILRLRDAAVVVDLVRDRAPQMHATKPLIGAIRVDPADEIFANKLCALLSRSEIRDLVDVMMLERAGLDLRDGILSATKKDGGLTPGQLGFVLSQVTIPEDAAVPATTRGELAEYLVALLDRLAEMAWPAGD